ncbi:hypothetical protein [Solibacillus sp.]|uniref:hypothetical protein n=1 Tax=Solibacillus sp. TaxID=1909654 RepID=UPI003314916E
MSKKKYFKIGILSLLLLSSALFVFLWNPSTNFTEGPETTVEPLIFSSKELAPYAEEYGRIVPNLLIDLGRKGYRVNVDLSLLDDENIEILIKKYEIVEDLKPNEIKEIEQLVNNLLKEYNFDPAMFKIDVSNDTQPILKTANRLSYRDLTEYIFVELADKGIEGFNINYKVSSEGSEIIIKLGEPFDETKDQRRIKEIKDVADSVLRKNNFNPDTLQVIVSNLKN